ncbi:glyoxylase-like metal-dependent hydrolase (beta-lactamase superfamily II) [Salirhabdus euzebyi]|uniref:Glyoxylase-like metal-dependent hydrolase (Beta-lactamase superfamily II) n=1 Tax=Salirhabdus euzebyi TaxID=394506 RepID=A0A841QAW0_9BACI|nr:MBL fold metallo-hydrolase [Salirhabdus euzebyi]MBB6455342.1 glyoxylase-like metal-dependent hydrolase (beta-lactamase superfamily II) [Salirhabdus euzebyi]
MLKTEKIYQLTVPTPYPVGDVHLYVLKGETLSLIDAGVNTDEAWDAVKVQLKEIGLSSKDFEQIFLTHHHPDHIGLVEHFERVQNIYGEKQVHLWLTKDETFLDHYKKFFNQLYVDFAVPENFHNFSKQVKGTMRYAGKGALTKFLNDGDILPGHEDWRVVETKGHAQSHFSFYNKKDFSLFSGDHILSHISSNPLLEPPMNEGENRPKPMLEYRDSMKKMLGYEVDQVYPGHGPIFRGIKHLIEERLVKQETRAEKVHKLLMEKPLTPFEVCQKLFPRQYERQLGLTMSETVGQLDYLESIEKVSIEKVNGHLVYHPK